MRLALPKSLLACAAVAALLPASATAAHKPEPFVAKATITACGGERLTIGAEIRPATRGADGRAADRLRPMLRGARLRMKFEAAPLFGSIRESDEIDAGRTTSARRFEQFAELPAQSYTGFVRYRWVRGSRTVVSGVVRTKTARAAGRRGRAFCPLPVGRPPVDTSAPVVFPLPSDETAWHRGPLTVNFVAFDDLSGVQSVVWQHNGGQLNFGRVAQLATEGTHTLTYAAADVAGNRSRAATVRLRVDANPPSAPTVTAPSGTGADPSPEIRWNAATDSASGVKAYFVTVKNAGDAVVWSQWVGPEVTATTVGQDLPAGQYTAEVLAVDGAAPTPFTTAATASFSVIAGGEVDSDADGRVDALDNCPFAANPEQANVDGDGAGDVCDADIDNDNIANASDNCQTAANPGQQNTGGGPAGDACEDRDGDGWMDGSDNCKDTANADQADADADGAGDACDPDDDNDGVNDVNASSSPLDNCRTVQNAGQADNDADGAGDACDADDDNDNVADASDNCPTTVNADQVNSDGAADGGDACDANDDNDAVNDTNGSGAPLDNCRTVPNDDQSDSPDADGIGNACDPDDDNDGDLDGADNCPTTYNPNQINQDGDSTGNACDSDADGDSVPNTTDPDDDNDGVPDSGENCDLVPAVGDPDGCPSDPNP